MYVCLFLFFLVFARKSYVFFIIAYTFYTIVYNSTHYINNENNISIKKCFFEYGEI